ncbi:hypothetical protein AZE42_05573 [Rhizopogon vesiculosus]|uniref:Neutral ceramidase n=1 Tax=Rhizopogon vesiculosus TaxID=180088 RepID=A0A1J8Q208_9AGAM|nr:hypothetical protein AZE42_05573 [Rhizopogon vesiculosus]
MYIPSFSSAIADSVFPFNWLQDAMHALVIYLAAFFTTTPSSGVGSPSSISGKYLIGLGIGDVTGPVVETNMMGYASLAQTDTGLHMRQRSRAFIVADTSNPSERVLFINSDICMGDTGIRRTIISSLASRYGDLYTLANTALVGTHAHSGVGGYLENLLPQVTSRGFVNDTAAAIVSGTLKAIADAHNSLAPGNLKLGNTTLQNANRNRSPSAYLANPEWERAMYEGDQDWTVSVLGFEDTNGGARGLMSFFPVHGTSLYENNTLVSGDNKGMAAWMYESYIEPSSMPGNNSFVAGFIQSNVGDTSPNTGPGFRISDFESNRMIGQAQFEATRTVMEGNNMTGVSGSVKSVHVYLDMTNYSFTLPNGTLARTCPAALGYSFAGGTSDGPGAFDFTQGHNSSQPSNPFWEIVKIFITPPPSEEQIACQYPKPILLNSGYAHEPYDWAPGTVDVQMLRVGQFVILVMPGELTTMAGRRMREALRVKLIGDGVLDNRAYVVIAGPGNTYGHYVATREEYGVQRYEGASTIFGPATLEAYINRYSELVPHLADNSTGSPSSNAAPLEQTSKSISMQNPVIVDHPSIFKDFGDVLIDVESSTYYAGDTVAVRFVGANPRASLSPFTDSFHVLTRRQILRQNNLRLEGTFFTVDQQVNGEWVVIKTDSHPSTTYKWNRTSTVLGTSTVDARWTIEDGTPAGTYRITYYGDAKSFLGDISAFTGVSSTFIVN